MTDIVAVAMGAPAEQVIHPESTSFPVLAVIELFEIDDGKLKELIYHAAFWTVRNLWDEENQATLDKRVEAMMAIHVHMVQLGYRPQDPQVLLNRLTENLNRCIERDESTDEAEMAEFEADMIKQRQIAAVELRQDIAKILLENSQSERYFTQRSEYLPEDTMTLEDLGLDSLALVDAAITLEEKFNNGVSVEDNKILECKTFGDVVKLAESLG